MDSDRVSDAGVTITPRPFSRRCDTITYARIRLTSHLHRDQFTSPTSLDGKGLGSIRNTSSRTDMSDWVMMNSENLMKQVSSKAGYSKVSNVEVGKTDVC